MSVSVRKNQGAGTHLWVGFKGLTIDDELKYFIKDFQIGGIVLFKRNVQSPQQLEALLKDAQRLALEELGRGLCVAIDQEGGPVQRLIPPFTQLPAAYDLAVGGPEEILEWTSRAATELWETGIHINLAPVLDIASSDTSTFMEKRILGSDPAVVAQLGKVWIDALQHKRISAVAKHYPGLGAAEADPHFFAPVIHWKDSAAMERDLMPFREAIAANVHCVMTSHALYPFVDPSWPATLSYEINFEWLRNRLGFKGVLLSDDLDMSAMRERYTWKEMAARGLLSSIDTFLLCQHSENVEVFYGVLSDVLFHDPTLRVKHDESMTRIGRLLQEHGLVE